MTTSINPDDLVPEAVIAAELGQFVKNSFGLAHTRPRPRLCEGRPQDLLPPRGCRRMARHAPALASNSRDAPRGRRGGLITHQQKSCRRECRQLTKKHPLFTFAASDREPD